MRKIFFSIGLVFGISFFILSDFTQADALTIQPASAQIAPIEESPAQEIFIEEREFLRQYVWDHDRGGFYYWVDRDGTVADPRKFSIFQANIILWLGGLDSQVPDSVNVEMIRSAADYLITELYVGNGEWYDYYDPETNARVEFFWNPRSDSFISYALLEAYRITGDEAYLAIAKDTNAAQRKKNPDGRIFAEFEPYPDIGYRFAEHMGQYEEYVLTGNIDALDYVQRYDALYRGVYARELVKTGQSQYTYYHGTAAFEKLFYGYLLGSEAAYAEGKQLHLLYGRSGHDDFKQFDPTTIGELSDNGRDFYDKMLAMELVEWSQTGEEKFRDEAVRLWQKDILRFWDRNAPYGFYVNLSQFRKTCFSIGQVAMLMDVTVPEIVDVHDELKSLWNHQLTVVVKDPEYYWNDHKLRGIGMDRSSLKIETPYGFQYGRGDIVPGGCEGCFAVELNYLSFANGFLNIKARDLFNNEVDYEQGTNGSFTLKKWQSLNKWSWLYYILVLLIFLFTVLFMYALWRYKWKKTVAPDQKKAPKMKKRPYMNPFTTPDIDSAGRENRKKK
ncbi:MAG: hypothetical protein COU35_01685 [Candidatus Magasanikbacteria bacterium CG10_big_fil_rev_8_21_14_0_10_47_10]|uniref:D-glucuronyl C5-epimerase C-terminal domain-containing protein n=1 Tax=Candidatus Magasanikbacteria bacterium CG10_big_fil_rev_8_21_14_0_10_47_10 TaxID=1974652 RepID=A0A2H0TQX3_9BACT|nr:MAG: hypothetical protein COU35_01685 [Candidatus Magasanikbacteria bacterium CG10_big_fil_rev_8_21_14_0_10_47_10]